MAPPRHRLSAAFTLVELLLVIIIVALLIALALPSLSGAMSSARSISCRANLKSLMAACHGYLGDHNGLLPTAFTEVNIVGGFWGPIPALAEYLDSSPPIVDTNGVVVVRAPYLCPADKDWASKYGFSYGYIPSQFMAAMSLEAGPIFVSRLYEHGSLKLVFVDRMPFHAPSKSSSSSGASNRAYYDGSVFGDDFRR